MRIELTLLAERRLGGRQGKRGRRKCLLTFRHARVPRKPAHEESRDSPHDGSRES
jgi:hypothetical protein